TLIRFYVLHIIVLPALYLGFVWITFATMRKVGLSNPDDVPPPTTTFRRHFANLVMIMLLLSAGMVTLATLFPFRFEGAADPYSTPKGVQPPWYMVAHYTLFMLPVPRWIPGLFILFVSISLPFLPAIVRALGSRVDERRLRMAGVAIFVVWVTLSVVGRFVERP
ncbi:MAG TPA: hypothetical protein VFV33_20245, partial [Gemmatimonadaceae bacterium]|nr:hypothetical protein [Gemmatimonadaceae bacterium]